MTRKKPSLKVALRRIEEAPDEMFGDVEVDISTLPHLIKKEINKKNFYGLLKQSLIEALEIARKNKSTHKKYKIK